jgi:thiamine-monophosphate kinase
LCKESGVGARLHAERLPVSKRFLELCAWQKLEPEELMLAGGEDYCLLFSLPKSIQPPSRYDCIRIGELTRDRSIRWIESGRESPLEPQGWDHLKAV